MVTTDALMKYWEKKNEKGEEKMFKNEVYKLTLEHYIIDDDRKKHHIDEPISTQCVICMKDDISIPIVLNSMFEKMRNHLLEIGK